MFFFFFLYLFTQLEKSNMWGEAVCFGLFVCFFYFNTSILLPHKRIEPYYKGKYGAERLLFYAQRAPLHSLATLSTYMNRQQDQRTTVTPQTLKPEVRNRLTSALRTFRISSYAFLAYHYSINSDSLGQIEKGDNKISGLLS